MNCELPVLFEGPSRLAEVGPNSKLAELRQFGPPQIMGRTPHNVKVNIAVSDAQAMSEWKGRVGKVQIERVNPHSLQGKMLGWL